MCVCGRLDGWPSTGRHDLDRSVGRSQLPSNSNSEHTTHQHTGSGCITKARRQLQHIIKQPCPRWRACRRWASARAPWTVRTVRACTREAGGCWIDRSRADGRTHRPSPPTVCAPHFPPSQLTYCPPPHPPTTKSQQSPRFLSRIWRRRSATRSRRTTSSSGPTPSPCTYVGTVGGEGVGLMG